MSVPKLRFKEFNDEWKENKLHDIAKITMGQSPNSENYTYDSSDTLLIQGNADLYNGKVIPRLFTKQITKTCDKEDIIMTVRAPVGDIAISDYYACIGRGVCSIKSSKFIYHYLDYLKEKGYWKKISKGSTIDSITSDNIKSLVIKTPSRKEQEKIIRTIDLINKKIELQTKKIEDLKLFKKGLISKLLNEYNYEIMKIKDVLKFEQPTKYIVNSDDYINDSKAIPVLTANKAFILGYCNENNVYDKGDSIIFDDFTMDMKYTNFNYKIKSSAIKILTAKDNNDLRFLYELLLSLNLKSKEHKRHYISIVQEMNVKIPSIEVQNSISSKLELIDNKILFEEKFLDNLTKLKKGFMQNMFV